MERVLLVAQTGRRWSVAFRPTGIVYSHTTVVFPLPEWRDFAVMQTAGHEEWRLRYGPSLRLDARYTPSDCFETFPFPASTGPAVDAVGEKYYQRRQLAMTARQEGLTALYNRFHSSDEHSADIAELRRLHVEMDHAIAAAYGWTDLDLGHGFHETKQGVRFTISEHARRELLARLLKLNHERYRQEVEQGLHDKATKSKAVKGRRTKQTSPTGPGLFG